MPENHLTLSEIQALSDKHLVATYGRKPVCFTRGDGVRLWDTEGKEYIDFLAGIAVCALGHAHPRLVQAIADQASQLMHTSNLYYIAPQARLAERLSSHVEGGAKAFFCNSGAEANETAIKLARKWAKTEIGVERVEILTMRNSFHGRTLTTVTATGQPKYQKGFEPLPGGFKYVPFNDIEAVRKSITAVTAAIMVEPVQGESGIHVADFDFLRALRELCDERDVLLIFDEVQCGIGRTGKFFAAEHAGVQADVITLAKALGGGFPIGAMLATERVANGLQPGDHGCTFGGNHLACTAALTVLDVIEEEDLLANVATVGGHLKQRLSALTESTGAITQVRGLGLMIGIQLREPIAARLHDACLQAGLVVNAIGDSVIRMTPPLILSAADADAGMEIFADCLRRLG